MAFVTWIHLAGGGDGFAYSARNIKHNADTRTLLHPRPYRNPCLRGLRGGHLEDALGLCLVRYANGTVGDFLNELRRCLVIRVTRRIQRCAYERPTGLRFTFGGYVGCADLPREDQGCLRLNMLKSKF